MKDTEILAPDAAGIARAGTLLASGGLVAFPTETVYGLGADATDDHAVARIFEVKGRPAFNPLIVHVPDIESARGLAHFDDMADRLASAFWPGPLTLVLPAREGRTSELARAGLATVAIRVPEHRVAQAVLRAAGRPIAAPSANPSGRVSPTEAAHVIASLGCRIDAVVDAGPCEIGIESTIIGAGEPAVLLRPGGLPVEAIQACLGGAVAHHAEGISAPGRLRSHYAPTGEVRLDATSVEPGETLLGFGHVDAPLNLSPSGDLVEAAAKLFASLHELDRRGAQRIAVSPIPHHGLGIAINDRLRRAAAARP
jgi:L-threonylcarbamoyladenylate synthase